MKLNSTALANALAVVAGGYFLVCAALVAVAPDLYRTIAQSWMHGVDLTSIWDPSLNGFVIGIVTFTASGWITGWVLGFAYNKFIGK